MLLPLLKADNDEAGGGNGTNASTSTPAGSPVGGDGGEAPVMRCESPPFSAGEAQSLRGNEEELVPVRIVMNADPAGLPPVVEVGAPFTYYVE